LIAASLVVLMVAGLAGGATSAWAGEAKGVTAAAVATTYCIAPDPGMDPGTNVVVDTNGMSVYFWCELGDGNIWHYWQLPGGGWSQSFSLGPPPGQHLLGTPDMVALPSGQLVLFAIGEDRQLWHKWQLCDGCNWSDWRSLGGGLASNPAVVRKSNGVLVAFALAFDRDLWHKWQLCNGCHWSGWTACKAARSNATSCPVSTYERPVQTTTRCGSKSTRPIAHGEPCRRALDAPGVARTVGSPRCNGMNRPGFWRL
jgi:hypothetical protein